MGQHEVLAHAGSTRVRGQGESARLGGSCRGLALRIDADKGTIDVRLTPAELQDRKRKWKPRQNMYGSGALQKFARLVGPAHEGAVTHPGFAGERQVYADI